MKNTRIEPRTPRVLVCQHGARHRYAVPRILEESGMLAALYTDSSASSFFGKCAKLLGQCSPNSVQRLAKREIVGVPSDKIFSSDYPLIKGWLNRLLGEHCRGVRAEKSYGDWLSKRMISRGVDGANIIYSMNCSNLEFVSYAKQCGCKSLIDVFIGPQTDRILQQEHKKFPDWGPLFSPDEGYLKTDLWQQASLLADTLLCPSEWVADGVREVCPEAAGKIRIVPYGCSIDYKGRVNVPVKARVLFAGGDALRKGLHDLAQATTQLKEDIPELDVRVAGSLPDNIVNHPIVTHVNFLGKLSLEQMKEEYLSADVFVLPSLAEGFASVVAEAIGAGCPVIVTRETGSPITDGIEGRFVLAGDINSLSSAIRSVITDRSLRDNMSRACLKRAPFYSEYEWRKRLEIVIRDLL